MENHVKKLLKNPLFIDLDYSFFTNSIIKKDCPIIVYKKGSLIAQEGEHCHSIGFILEGYVSAKQLSPDGKVLTIHTFYECDAIGAAIFGLPTKNYPFSIYAEKDSLIFYLHYRTVEELIRSNPVFSINYIQFLSHRIDEFKNKIQLLQYKDVRSRLIRYLTSESKRFQSTSFTLRHSKSAISDMIGVARPSISRELKHMSDEGLITFSGKEIQLLKVDFFN